MRSGFQLQLPLRMAIIAPFVLVVLAIVGVMTSLLTRNLITIRLGGRVECHSNPGGGTLFRIDIPDDRSAADPTHDPI